MASGGTDARCFQSGRSGADNGNLFYRHSRLQCCVAAPEFGVVHTADRFTGVAIGDAGIGANAGADLCGFFRFYFADNSRVTDMRAGHANHIGFAGGNNLIGL